MRLLLLASLHSAAAFSPQIIPSYHRLPTAAPLACAMVATESSIAEEPVFTLSSGPSDLQQLRVGDSGSPATYDAVLTALLAVGDDDNALAAFTAANRDLLDYRFLYRLTSEKLRAKYTGDAAREEKLTVARARRQGVPELRRAALQGGG